MYTRFYVHQRILYCNLAKQCRAPEAGCSWNTGSVCDWILLIGSRVLPNDQKMAERNDNKQVFLYIYKRGNYGMFHMLQAFGEAWSLYYHVLYLLLCRRLTSRENLDCFYSLHSTDKSYSYARSMRNVHELRNY